MSSSVIFRFLRDSCSQELSGSSVAKFQLLFCYLFHSNTKSLALGKIQLNRQLHHLPPRKQEK